MAKGVREPFERTTQMDDGYTRDQGRDHRGPKRGQPSTVNLAAWTCGDHTSQSGRDHLSSHGSNQPRDLSKEREEAGTSFDRRRGPPTTTQLDHFNGPRAIYVLINPIDQRGEYVPSLTEHELNSCYKLGPSRRVISQATGVTVFLAFEGLPGGKNPGVAGLWVFSRTHAPAPHPLLATWLRPK
ncbi:uncharacterized protein LOC143265488 [Megachile rotundata]|uniref:uncharacterized protein LOC143265488 n=1 Tax=Megachile rotundata TaxID=143995 RepID=UPI003FCFA979